MIKTWLPEAARQSPQSVDPLSWFTRPFLPVTFAVVAGSGGTFFVLATHGSAVISAFHLLAVLSFVLACLSIHRRPGPRLTPFRLRDAVVPLVLASIGVIISGVSIGGSLDDLTRWWAPLGFSLVLIALAPYSSAVMMLLFGVLGTIVCVTVAMMTLDLTQWPPLTTALVVGVTLVQATIAAALFSISVVDRTLRWTAFPVQASLAPNPELSFARWETGSAELKLLSEQVMPFIEKVASDGFISMKDRSVATDLAGQVRTALTRAVDSSWLDTLSAGHSLRVIDPNSRAGNLSVAQQGALRGLVLAVLASPALLPDSLAIELRDGPDNEVAVGLTMRLELPEGERLMMIAPYYLALQSTVNDLAWDDTDQMTVRFRIPAPTSDER